MDKLFRNYVLFVQKNDTTDSGEPNNFIEVGLPFTVDFDVQKNTLSSINNATIRVYNLSPESRNSIAMNAYDKSDYKRVILKAGYGNTLSLIFQGNINSCQSVRQGTEFITTIEARDGGFSSVNDQFTGSFPKNQFSQSTIIRKMIQSCATLSIGAIGDLDTTLIQRGNAYSGPTLGLISELCGGASFIDNEKLNVILDDEYIDTPTSDIPLITADSGLLGTPVRQETFLVFDVIFEPRAQIGRVVELRSITGLNYDGFYKVIGLQHKGVISGAVCGDLVTSIQVPFIKGYTAVTPEQAI